MNNTPLINYRRSPKGVLTNMYDHMRRRHPIEFSLVDFHDRYLTDKKYLRLHTEWIESGCIKNKKPSLDRISSKGIYSFANTHMMTWGENRFKQTIDGKSRRGAVLMYDLQGNFLKRFIGQKIAAKSLGISQGNLSRHLLGNRKTCGGYIFCYENPDLLEVTE